MRKTIAGGAALFAVSLAVTGCGNSNGAGGDSTVSLDGKAVTGKLTTTCAKHGDLVALAIADDNNETYGKLAVGATLSTDGKTVTSVAISGSKGGTNGGSYTLGYTSVNGTSSGGTAKVTVDGGKYTVKGEGTATDLGAIDMSDPMNIDTSKLNQTKPFEVVFDCGDAVT